MKDANGKFYPVAEELRAGHHVPYRDSVWSYSRTPADPAAEVEWVRDPA